MIMSWDVVLTPVSRVNHERLKWLGSQSIANVLRHNLNLSTKPQGCNTEHDNQEALDRRLLFRI